MAIRVALYEEKIMEHMQHNGAVKKTAWQPSTSEFPKNSPSVNVSNDQKVKVQKKVKKKQKNSGHTKRGDVKHGDAGIREYSAAPYVPPQKRPLLDRQLYICEKEQIRYLQKNNAKNPRAVFLCTLCEYHCDTWGVVEYHINQARHQKLSEELTLWRSAQLLPKPRSEQIILITSLLKSMIIQHGIDDFSRMSREVVALRINRLIEQHLPGCTIQLYGSSYSMMGLKTSDINLNLNVPSDLNCPRTMMKMLQLLKDDERNIDVDFDVTSDMPKIIFVDKLTKLQCAVCINIQTAVHISILLAKYASIDGRVRTLAVAFRLWANMCALDRVGSGTFPAIAFALMVVYYLQQLDKPVLPVLHEMVPVTSGGDFNPEYYLDPAELNGIWVSSNCMSVGELWLGLLNYYLFEFDMNEKVVSIVSKDPVTKTDKKWSSGRKKVAIEDPFMPNRNLAKSIVNVSSFDYFMGCLRTTYTYYATPQLVQGPIFFRLQQLAEEGNIEMDALFKRILTAPVFSKHKDDKVMSDIGNGLQRMAVSKPAGLLENKNRDFENSKLSQLIVSPEQAEVMYQKLNPDGLQYQFKKDLFTGKMVLPNVCVLCHENGHSKATCPHEVFPPLENLPPLAVDHLKALNVVCNNIFEYSALCLKDYAFRETIVAELQEIISIFYPDVCVTMFGSSCNGFGFRKSDLDICITFKNNESGKGLNFSVLIEELYQCLLKYPKLQNLVPITTAKVPILKFYHRTSQLEGDISFYNILGQENTRLLKTYSNIDIRAKILGHVLKRFAKLCDICDASRGSLSSYAYVLMVIYFLQQCEPPVLPVLQELSYPVPVPERIVQGCSTYFFEDIANLSLVWPEYGMNNTSVGELWIQLLCFYTQVFDFRSHVISIKQKEVLPKFEKFWNSRRIAIEDPFDLNHNLGIGLSRKMHSYIILSFRKGREHFGYARDFSMCKTVTQLTNFFFKHKSLTVGAAPYSRGCLICKRIGHRCKDCPDNRRNKQRQEQAT